jgi:hypothetical protein
VGLSITCTVPGKTLHQFVLALRKSIYQSWPAAPYSAFQDSLPVQQVNYSVIFWDTHG